jgi:flavin-dependent thymidylate synthase
MRIVLAGYNVDAELLEEATSLGLPSERLSPETLSAAYARISRSPAPVDELRRAAREEVAKARASNEQIVFGLGHASVAEHAVFNFDLMGISRLAIEAVEHFRLCSYTEKSQRYIRLEDDFVLPREIVELGFTEKFQELVDLQHRTYHDLYQKLREHIFARHPELAGDKAQQRTLDGWAKEDARYVTSLAVEGQLGLTANARNLEHMIRRLAAHPLQEVRELAAQLKGLAREVAPSLIRHTDAPSSEPAPGATLCRIAADILEPDALPTLPGQTGAVQLVGWTPEADAEIVAALLQSASRAPWISCHERARCMTREERVHVIRTVLRPMTVHDAPPRVFELVWARFDVVVSASCFAQLKRHRMSTLLPQAYDPTLGFTMPEAIERVGMQNELRRVMAASGELHREVAQRHPQAACYALTQAHRRRVLLQMSARELYHFSRLRQDHHAQWEIRGLADRMLHLAREVMPDTLMLACGKDAFEEKHREIFPAKRGKR